MVGNSPILDQFSIESNIDNITKFVREKKEWKGSSIEFIGD